MKLGFKHTALFFTCVTLGALVFNACKQDPVKPKEDKPVEIKGHAQGTTYSIKYIDSLNRNFKPQIDSILNVIDHSLSTYNKKSIITKFNEAKSCGQIDFHFLDVFFLSDEVYEASDGAFDPTVLPLMKIWDFDKDSNLHYVDSATLAMEDSVARDSIITLLKDSMIDECVDNVGFELLSLEGDIMYNKMKDVNNKDLQDNFICKDDSLIQITFDAIAQGYSADMIGEWLELHMGIKSYIIEIGGEVLAQGFKDRKRGLPWKVSIEHPDVSKITPGGLAQVKMQKFRAVAVSGNYRKFVEHKGQKIGHNIDPRTGYPSKNNMVSVAVFADDCATADAFATAFMIMDMEESVLFVEHNPFQNLEAVFVYENEDGELESYTSVDLEEELIFPNDSIQKTNQ